MLKPQAPLRYMLARHRARRHARGRNPDDLGLLTCLTLHGTAGPPLQVRSDEARNTNDDPDGMRITGKSGEAYDEVLTAPAMAFLGDLHRTFDTRRLDLLQARSDRYEKQGPRGSRRVRRILGRPPRHG